MYPQDRPDNDWLKRAIGLVAEEIYALGYKNGSEKKDYCFDSSIIFPIIHEMIDVSNSALLGEAVDNQASWAKWREFILKA